jgi:uncharacterized protein (DUF697 family)
MRHFVRIAGGILVAVIAAVVFLLGAWKGGALAVVIGVAVIFAFDWILQQIFGPSD